MSNDRRGVTINVSKNVFSLFLLVIGLLLCTLTYYFLGPDQTLRWKSMFYDLLRLISGVLVSAAVIGLTLQVSNIQNTFNNLIKYAFEDLMDGNFKFEKFNYEALDNIKNKVVISKVAKKGLSVDEEWFSKSPYYKLEPFMEETLSGICLLKHHRTTTVVPNSKKGVFIKTVKLQEEYINPNLILPELSLNIIFNQEPHLSKEQKLEKISITKYLINGLGMNSSDAKILVEADKYFSVFIKYNLGKDKYVKVEIEYSYEVPMCDFTQELKLIHPCQDFDERIFLSGPEINDWELQATGFASFYTYPEETEEMSVFVQENKHAFINFKQWVAPGAGYVISFRRVENTI